MAFFLIFLAMMATAASGVAGDSEVSPVLTNGDCGQVNYPGFKIINGRKATRCQFPWMTFLYIEWPPKYSSCGASIISDRWILTAGHCLPVKNRNDTAPPETIHIYTGMLDKRDRSNHHVVDKVIFDPRFKLRDAVYDAVLLRLAKPIKWDECHAPVCLNSNKNVDPNLGLCIISGWGYTAYYPHPVPTNKLLFAYDYILPQKLCKEIYKSHASENTICGYAGRKPTGRGVCGGDSGGPLVCQSKRDGRYYQHGIASRYLSQGYCRMEMLYTNVGEIYDWIIRETSR